MIDVHPPDHTPHGIRDFAIHLLTITAGLLIALALENAAEALHHRHQRDEADSTIRRELRDNRQALVDTQATLREEMANMLKILDFADSMSQGKKGDTSGLTLAFKEHPLQDAAWKTAAATGVLSFMEYSRVQTYALAYQEQTGLESLQAETLDNYLLLDSYAVKGFDPSQITPDEVKEALPQIRHALAHLAAMLDVSKGVMQDYDAALK